MSEIANLRREYSHAELTEATAPIMPLPLFRQWYGDATAAEIREPNGMTLATVGPDGQPAARIVLLKGFDEEGFVFYTNYLSRKGKEMEERPRVAVVFWWPEIERQVRIEGTVSQVSPAESDEYFASRPLGSRIGAWVSEQSKIVPGREILETRFTEHQIKYGENPPRPPYWGGYRLHPEAYEFWQGRESRLHDRLRYTRLGGKEWLRVRLAP